MRVVINHDQCQHSSAYADRCLSQTIRNPLGHQRFCGVELTDDGKPELTVVLIFDGEEHTLVLNDLNREQVASLGWAAFADPELMEEHSAISNQRSFGN